MVVGALVLAVVAAVYWWYQYHQLSVRVKAEEEAARPRIPSYDNEKLEPLIPNSTTSLGSDYGGTVRGKVICSSRNLQEEEEEKKRAAEEARRLKKEQEDKEFEAWKKKKFTKKDIPDFSNITLGGGGFSI